MASAIEEQSAVTQEVTESMQVAAGGVSSISRSLEKVVLGVA